MKILHEKSHSCHHHSWHHGDRRRKCSVCGRTWTIWPRKRGRKCSRPDSNLLQKIFVERQRLKQTAAVRLKRIGLSAASRRLSKAMAAATGEKAKQHFPGQQYILIIDALWYCLQRQHWTLYLSAVRTVRGKKARLLPPVLLSGKENLRSWQTVIGLMPEGLKSRIKAMVSDGWRGVEGVAKDNGWILQRCHFHLISQLQVNRGKWKQLLDQNFREQIYQTARKLLTTRTRVNFYKERLIRLTAHPQCPTRLKKIIRDYLRRLKHFRAYLNHQELNLPTTTNCIESTNKLIREQSRYLKTPRALAKWSKTFLRLNQNITCNGAKNPQN